MTNEKIIDGVRYREIEWCPDYWVGENGTVWSTRFRFGREHGNGWHPVKSTPRSSGGLKYHRIFLRPIPGGKRVTDYLHRVVLEAFVGPCPDGMQGCHNDGDVNNNRLTNLRWDTQQSNMDDQLRHGTRCRGTGHPHHKITELQAKTIVARYMGGEKQDSIARDYGIAQTTVSSIVTGTNWKHLPSINTVHRRKPPYPLFGEKHHLSKLSDKDVLAIRQMIRDGENYRIIAGMYGVSRSLITRIKQGYRKGFSPM